MGRPTVVDALLDRLDSAAQDLDGRKYQPRRKVMKSELSELVHGVGTDAGQAFTRALEEQLRNGWVPDKDRIEYLSHKIREEYSQPAGDQGKYSLYRED